MSFVIAAGGFLGHRGVVGLIGGTIIEIGHTATTASLISTAPASGGTAPYTYQWERKQGAGAFAPVSGATGASFTDIGPLIPNNTAYTYRRRATDADSDQALSNEVVVATNVLVVTLVTINPASLSLRGQPIVVSVNLPGVATTSVRFIGSAATIPLYDVGDTAQIEVEYRDPDNSDALVDPISVAFEYRKPNGTVVPTTPVRQSTGKYRIAIAIDIPGNWRFEWTSSGPVTQEEGMFAVQGSSVP